MSEPGSATDGAHWITDRLWPGSTLTSERRRGAAARYVAVPNAAAPTQLLPAAWTSVVAVGSRPSDDRPRAKALRDALGIAALVATAPFDRRRRVSVTGDPASSLVAHLRAEIDPAIHDAVVLCGPARANRKPVLQLHDRRGRTVAYAKVAWNELTRSLLAHERDALAHLATRVGSDLQVPRVLGAGRFGDADWLAIGPVGVTRRSAPSDATAFSMARTIERTADEWRGPAAENPFVRRLVASSAGLARSSGIVDAFAKDHATGDLVLRAAHGDFVPWNTLSGEPAPAIWDWERYEQHAPVGFDRFHHVFQTSIFRRGMAVGAAIAHLDARLGEIVPELGDLARLHLDGYLAHLLCRYERDAQPATAPPAPNGSSPSTTPPTEHADPPTDRADTPIGVVSPNPSLMARVADMATVLEQRRSRQ